MQEKLEKKTFSCVEIQKRKAPFLGNVLCTVQIVLSQIFARIIFP